MSEPGLVRYESDGVVARITFDRPAARNAMTWSMYEDLATAIERLERESPPVCLLRGAGGHFVAGTDIAQFEAFASGEDGVSYEHFVERVLSRLEATPVPTIAVCEGHAAGAGLLIAAVCDLRICTPEARFSAPIARTVGNTVSLPNHARLIAHFGPSRTKALLMSAASIDADTALAIGFVQEMAPAEQLEHRALELATRVAGLAPLTLRATKAMVRQVLASSRPGSEEALLRDVYGSRDFREGVRAFIEKRVPKWEGR